MQTISTMSKTLVIGSTVADIIINVEELPSRTMSVNAIGSSMSAGGCAFNCAYALKLLGADFDLFSPVGTGIYGSFVAEKLKQFGIESICPRPTEENGSCTCLVDKSGERTFISVHGAEYKFKKEWFDALDASVYDSVYLCGIEIEEDTGVNIIEFLERNPKLTVYFAPGPRLMSLDAETMERMFKLSPVLHLNEQEICECTGINGYKDAAKKLFEKTGNLIAVTLGEKGCYAYDNGEEIYVPGVPAKQIDTIGAGDGHIGAIIAGLSKGKDLEETLRTANAYAAAIVECKGALLGSLPAGLEI